MATVRIAEKIVRLNSCLDMDINVVEWCVDSDGQQWVIDCPERSAGHAQGAHAARALLVDRGPMRGLCQRQTAESPAQQDRL